MRTYSNLCLIAFILLSALSALSAQRLPTTNVVLFNFKQLSDSSYLFTNPQFLTGFNPDGYNNQPYFMSSDELYLTVQFPADTSQTDIVSLNLRTRTLTRVTRTKESEFSPAYVPPPVTDDKTPKAYFSCVRVRNDGSGIQQLWRYPMDRSSLGNPVFNSISNVGYYSWVNSRRVALFLVGNPHTLKMADLRNPNMMDIATNIGRCLQQMPGNGLAYLDKNRGRNGVLQRVDTRFYRNELITASMSENEDFVVLPDGTFIMAQGNKLYKFNRVTDYRWTEIGDFSYYGFEKISRIAITDNKIALVVE